MSVTIRDLLKLPVFSGAKVVAGLDHLDAMISYVSVLEATGVLDTTDDDSAEFKFPWNSWDSTHYNQGIIISAMLAAKDDVQKQLETIRRVRQIGQNALILYYVGYILPRIDQRIIALADQIGLPLIVMPSDPRLRYSDAITEIMEAIIEDRRKNSYFASDIIERLSKFDHESRTINNVLAVIRDRTETSVLLYDEDERELNRAEWPIGRKLPIRDIMEAIRANESPKGRIFQISEGGNQFAVYQGSFEAAGSMIDMVVIKERTPLTEEMCDQIQYILHTYINLWAKEYGRVDTKQLISSIILDEPEKMHRIARSMKLDLSHLSSVYYFYPEDPTETGNEPLREAKSILQKELHAYSNKFIIDIFDQTLIIMADRSREQIDEDLPAILDTLKGAGLAFNAVICNPALVITMIKESYWLFQHNIKEMRVIFPYKRVFSISEIDFVQKIKTKKNTDQNKPFVYHDYYRLLIEEKKDTILIDTLTTLLLDADMNVTDTAARMHVHKSTIKYRIKCIEDAIGHRISKTPEIVDLYELAGLYRLIRNESL